MTKKEPPSNLGSHSGIPSGDPQLKSGRSKVLGTNESSSKGQENAGRFGKRKHGGWDPTPPLGFRPRKLYKTLYIPVKKYPEYNFVGLILGPRGRNQKKIETETGARIIVKSKGLKRDPKPLVLVEADTQKSLNAAVAMVEKLLVPPQGGEDEIKLSQLRELAELNNTLRVKNTHKRGEMTSETDVPCEIHGDGGRYAVACPLTAPLPGNRKNENNSLCETRGDPGHHTVACPFPGKLLRTEAHENNMKLLAAPGSGFSPFASLPPLGNQPFEFRAAANSVCLGSDKFHRDVAYTNLYVAHLPQYVDVNMLIQLFSPFGALSSAQVIRDISTGLTKGYGFVKYYDPASAAAAVKQMNGYRIDGNVLAVQVAGNEHSPPDSMQPVKHSSISFPPAYQNSSAIAHIPAPTCWPGLPGSSLHATYDLPPYASYASSYTSPMPSSLTSAHATSEELVRFPGNPDNFVPCYPSLFS